MPKFDVCVDVGNSRTKFGLFHADRPTNCGGLPECVASIVVPHGQPIRWENVRKELPAGSDDVRGFVAGSSPDDVIAVMRTWPTEWASPIRLEDVQRFPITVRLESPNQAGVDRILNAIACNVIRPSGRPAVIVDTGTATTVDAVAPDGAFIGGAIFPGFELCARALHHYTALLPLISIDELLEESHEAVGTNTREALRSGLLWGQVGAIKELVGQLGNRWNADPFLVLTGGAAPLPAPHLPCARSEPALSLQGLAIVAQHFADAGA